MGLGRALDAAAKALTRWAVRARIPRPPYIRRNAIVRETIGRRSGRARRVPVGFEAEWHDRTTHLCFGPVALLDLAP
jgi:hypothetical protein